MTNTTIMASAMSLATSAGLPTRATLIAMGTAIAREGVYAPRTIEQYHRQVRQYEARGGGYPCSQADFIAYVTRLVATPGVHGGPMRADTIRQHIAAIRWEHRRRGLEDPMSETVREILRARRRALPDIVKRAKPIRPALLWRLVKVPVSATKRQIRDAAMIALGWSCALRASEIIGIRLADMEWVDDGLIVTIRQSKGDQEGRGQFVHLPATSGIGLLEVVRRWVDCLPYTSGYLFPRITTDRGEPFQHMRGHTMTRGLTRSSVWLIVRARLEAVGEPVAGYSPHSLRAGFATSCAEAGASLIDIQRQTRHRSLSTLLTYIRDADAMKNHALKAIKGVNK